VLFKFIYCRECAKVPQLTKLQFSIAPKHILMNNTPTFIKILSHIHAKEITVSCLDNMSSRKELI